MSKSDPFCYTTKTSYIIHMKKDRSDAKLRLAALAAEEEEDEDDAELILRQGIKSAQKREEKKEEDYEHKVPPLDIISHATVEVEGEQQIAPVMKGGGAGVKPNNSHRSQNKSRD